ncbi:putative retinol dehydrogenase 12 [Phaeomoniella chlamydospora]|uniref:Putative retinol dehydrogenase 12 n=1 Tax=Phaeomoniella chlamydospora TaxID=158046 RepID=A0A0G2E6M7_PHACM|nr:putative retinol dehydrogenase 12 [Phaeomoniella chlamydospora]
MDTIRNTIAENFGGPAQKLATHKFSLEECPDLSGKVMVGTGLTEGIGYGVMYTLLKNNISKVHAISTSEEVKDAAINDIAENLGEPAAQKVQWYQCDLSDWAKVAKIASKIAKSTSRIDILFNNAGRGIMTYQLTDLGVDRHMAVNHIAHVILTSHLLPVMKKTASEGHTVRIVNQSSNAHQASPSTVEFSSVDELNQDLGPNGQYGRSKLAVLLHARYLARHLSSTHPNILANATHPGFVATTMSTRDIHEPYPLAGYAMSVGMQPFKKDQWEGATSAVYALTKTVNTGEYICPPAVPESGTELSQDEGLAEQLMELTRSLIKEKLPEESDLKDF